MTIDKLSIYPQRAARGRCHRFPQSVRYTSTNQAFTARGALPAAVGAALAFTSRGGTVTQRCIEMVIGRLVTDEAFRNSFLSDPHRALGELLERGTHLTHAEIAALVATDFSVWDRAADQVDPRLQKISLKP